MVNSKVNFNSIKWKHILLKAAESTGIILKSGQVDKFAVYAEELLDWNRITNLTSITDPVEIAVKHFIDSMLVSKACENWKAVRLADIGSGAGFPGIPLKILMPYIYLSLVDSSAKRVSFQKYLLRILNIKSVETLHIRLDEISVRDEFQNAFDVILSRAFSDLKSFVLQAESLLNSQGIIIAMKGKKAEEELSEFKEAERFSVSIKKYTLPYINQTRALLVFKPR
ncbi:Ribosomal RNA small subunit methyltransferase G [Candidatus Magnetomoraceae bacterium gMMP-15]